MQPPDDRRPTLKPPQFRLRTLLLAVGACAVVFTSFQWLSPLGIMGVLFLLLCIGGHIAGNAIGMQLRDNGDHPLPPPDEETRLRQFRPPTAAEMAEATQLSRASSLGWVQWIATLTGFVVGGIGGGLGAALLSRKLEESIVLLGIAAFATLGGIVAFVAYSFVQVGWNAILQADRSTHSRV
jgi:hypothetical protein